MKKRKQSREKLEIREMMSGSNLNSYVEAEKTKTQKVKRDGCQ